MTANQGVALAEFAKYVIELRIAWYGDEFAATCGQKNPYDMQPEELIREWYVLKDGRKI